MRRASSLVLDAPSCILEDCPRYSFQLTPSARPGAGPPAPRKESTGGRDGLAEEPAADRPLSADDAEGVSRSRDAGDGRVRALRPAAAADPQLPGRGRARAGDRVPRDAALLRGGSG